MDTGSWRVVGKHRLDLYGDEYKIIELSDQQILMVSDNGWLDTLKAAKEEDIPENYRSYFIESEHEDEGEPCKGCIYL